MRGRLLVRVSARIRLPSRSIHPRHFQQACCMKGLQYATHITESLQALHQHFKLGLAIDQLEKRLEFAWQGRFGAVRRYLTFRSVCIKRHSTTPSKKKTRPETNSRGLCMK